MDIDKKASEPVRLEVEVLNDSMDEESPGQPETIRTDDTDGDTDLSGGGIQIRIAAEP